MFGKPSATARRFWTVVATLAVCVALLPMAGAAAATAYTLTINDVAAAEGNAGTTTFTFTVNLAPAAVSDSVTVNYATADGSAAAPGDYTAASGLLTFSTGQNTKTINVTVAGDLIDEGFSEIFSLNLSGATAPAGDSVAIGDGTGIGTILDDDAAPTMSISAPAASESALVLNFVVTLSGPSATALTTNYATTAGTATAGTDFIAAAGSLTFLPGETSKVLPITLVNDAIAESTEAFTVTLSGYAGGYTVPAAIGTILDDDIPVINIGNASAPEGSGLMGFRLTLSQPVAGVTVQYSTAAGTATSGVDFGAVAGALCGPFADDPLTVAVDFVCDLAIAINPDALVEADETFSVILSNPINATIGTGTGTGTILDDEGIPTVSIANKTANEAAGTLDFTLTLSAPYFRPITVDYFTLNGTAVAPADFTAQGGPPPGPPAPKTVTIPAGATTATLSVPLVNDTASEPSEGFTIYIGNPTFATLGTGGAGWGCGAGFWPVGGYCAAGGTITDNDLPVVSLRASGAPVWDGPALEGASMWGQAVLDADPILPGLQGAPFAVTVDYTTVDGTATGGPLCTADYFALNGTLTFAPGATIMMVAPASVISTCGDTVYEGTEDFKLRLSNPVNATIGTAERTFTILDANTKPTVNVWSPVVAHSETSVGIGFYIYLTFPGGTSSTVLPVTVSYATQDGSAFAGQDYQPASGTVTFPCSVAAPCGPGFPGTMQIDAPYVLLIDDPIYEVLAIEQFLVVPSNTINAFLGTIGAANIIDNEVPPTVTMANASASEGAGVMSFTVTLSHPSAMPTVAVFRSINGTAVATPWPTLGGDYLATPPGGVTVTFNPMETTKTIAISIVEDALVEGNEEFLMVCGPPAAVNGVCGPNATGTIVDNDLPVVRILTPAAGTLEDGGPLNFTVTITGFAGPTVTGLVKVNYTSADLLAMGGLAPCSGSEDFSTTTGTLTWNIGDAPANKTISVPLCADAVDEPDETFTMTLSGAIGATLFGGGATQAATGTILDDDKPNISINDISLLEGNAGTTAFTFTVLATSAETAPMTVNYTFAHGSTANSDFSGGALPAGGTLTFAPGEMSKTITVLVSGDLLQETDEVFSVTLAGATNSTLAAKFIGYGTIRNDDIQTASIADASKTEGNVGTSNMTFTVTLSNPTLTPTLINWTAIVGGPTPAAGTDFTVASGTLTIAAGGLTGTIDVVIVGDTVDELDETFLVNLTANAANPALPFSDNSATGTIIDDDADVTAPVVTVPGPMTVEATARPVLWRPSARRRRMPRTRAPCR